MKNLYGLTNIQTTYFLDVDDLNVFLLENDGNIVDIQIHGNKYYVIYKDVEIERIRKENQKNV
jgi:hypothetical protein